MLSLFISIAFTALIYLIFRAFQQYQVDSFPGIVLNYFTCVVLGSFFMNTTPQAYFSQADHGIVLMAALLGIGFITVFNLMNATTQLLGVAGGTVVSRMSLVIPASFSLIMLHEGLSLVKAIGIALALASIYFTVFSGQAAKQAPSGEKQGIGKYLIPLLSFFGVGAVDTMLKISDVYFLKGRSDTFFIVLTYFFAFLAGALVLLVKRVPLASLFKKKNLFWGALLGVCNYFSIYFFILALTKGHIEGSKMFPINSVGIVALSTIASMIIFREKINLRKGFGLLLALSAILLISMG